VILISPSEPKELAELTKAEVSPLPEDYGSDFLLPTRHGLCGIQRKVERDFINSISDGRLQTETSLMEPLVFKILILEGNLMFLDGILYKDGHPTRFTKEGVRNLLRSLFYQRGIRVEFSDSLKDTAQIVLELADYFEKPQHQSLYTRPPCPSQWGTPTFDEQALWLLQGFRGIGATLASKILKHFGGVPLKWSCSKKELAEIVGRKKAEKLFSFLNEAESGSF